MRMSYRDFSTLTVLPVESPKSRCLECIFVSVLGVSDVSKYRWVHIFLFYLILGRCFNIGVSSGNQQRHNMIGQAKLLLWWRHQMETFSALLVLCAGNSPVPGEFPSQRLVTRSFDVFFDLCPNKRLSKQSWGRWFEKPSRSLWCHGNVKAAGDILRGKSVVWRCLFKFTVSKVFLALFGKGYIAWCGILSPTLGYSYKVCKASCLGHIGKNPANFSRPRLMFLYKTYGMNLKLI